MKTSHASLKSLRAVPICPVSVPGISVLSDISLVTKGQSPPHFTAFYDSMRIMGLLFQTRYFCTNCES